jgi:threonine dehydrogenase-like Zn-dependent dehydrogenase
MDRKPLDKPFPTIKAATDPNLTHTAVELYGNKSIQVNTARPRPVVTDPGDCIVRITTTTICGSDLHLYHHEFQGIPKGYVLGHEPMGVVVSVGPSVRDINVGDRVVVSAVITEGDCWYCKNGFPSWCEGTNPSKRMEEVYGHRLAGIFGYSELLGGYDGGQAEYLRVPYADLNCLKIPVGIPDEKVLFLSDIMCTGWHGNELGAVAPGQTVAIWGAGPVGQMAAMWAKFRGARVIIIDKLAYRLSLAASSLNCVTINSSEVSVVERMREICPGGPDVAIECVGFRFPESVVHKMERLLRAETDTPEVLHECIMCLRKGGTLAIIGDYYMLANQFPIGPLMEKGIVVRGGQVHVQRYWKHLLQLVIDQKVDPSFVISHIMPLEKAADAYKMFDKREQNAMKILLKPQPPIVAQAVCVETVVAP